MGLGFAHRGSRFARHGLGKMWVLVVVHGGGWVLMWDRQNVDFDGC